MPPIHHLEDLQTGTRNDPNMRERARELIDQARDLRRKIDDLRIKQEVAQQRLNKTI